MLLLYDLFLLKPGLRSGAQIRSLEPKPITSTWWNRNWSLESFTAKLLSKRDMQVIECFQFPMDQIILEQEPEPKNCICWSQNWTLDALSWSENRSLKFAFRLHSRIWNWKLTSAT